MEYCPSVEFVDIGLLLALELTARDLFSLWKDLFAKIGEIMYHDGSQGLQISVRDYFRRVMPQLRG